MTTKKIKLAVTVDSYGAYYCYTSVAVDERRLTYGDTDKCLLESSPRDPRKVHHVVLVEADVPVPDFLPEVKTVVGKACPTCFQVTPAKIEEKKT